MSVELHIVKILLKIGCALYAPNSAVQELINALIDQTAEAFCGKMGTVEKQIERVIDSEISENALRNRRIPEDKLLYIQSEVKHLLAEVPLKSSEIANCKGDVNKLANKLVDYYQQKCTYPLEEAQHITNVLKTLIPKLLNCLPKDPNYLFQGIIELHGITDDLRKQIEELKRQMTQNIPPRFPAFISDRPLDQAELFLGRDKIVHDTIEKITCGESAILFGIGGVGKTEIAKAVIKHFERRECEEHGITKLAWVEYNNQNIVYSIVQSFKETRGIADIEQAWEKACSIIQELRGKLLIVIDNVENVSQDYNLLRIADLPCRLLVTSREEKISSLQPIPVDFLAEEECKELFLHYYKKRPAATYLVERVVRLAGLHTVTIELLAKIAQVEDIALNVFYNKLVELGFDLSEEKAGIHHERLQKEERIIEQLAILFSVYLLREEEVQLLIPISAIPAIPFCFNQAKTWFAQKDRTNLNHLARTGWLQTSQKEHTTQYVMHSVVASAVRYQFRTIIYSKCRDFIAVLTEQMQYREDEHGSDKSELIQFSWSLNDLLHDHLHDELDGDFLFYLSRIYKDIGNYKQAVYLLRRCIRLYHHQKKSLKRSNAYNLLGLVYQDKSEPTFALTQYRKTLQFMCGSEVEIYYISVFSNMGLAYMQLEGAVPNGKANKYLSRALDMAEQHYGTDDPRTLDIKFKLANCIAPRDSARAIQIFNEVIEKEKRIYGERHLILAAKYQEVGNYLYDMGKISEAGAVLESALTIYVDKLGHKHPKTADTKNTLALIYQKIDNEKSRQYFFDYLEAAEDIYGEYSPVTAAAHNNLGCYYESNNDFDNALAEFERAEGILRGISYYNLEDLGQFLINQAQCHNSCGRFPSALKVLNDALLELKKDYRVCADIIARCYGVMGSVYCNMDNKPEAYRCFENAIDELQSIWGEEHLSMASIYNNYAILLEEDKKFPEALEKLSKAKQILQHADLDQSENMRIVEESICRIQKAIDSEDG